MLGDQGEFAFPVGPDHAGGKPALQKMSEAQFRDECHDQWHRDNPGQSCSPGDWPASDYTDISRGQRMTDFGGASFEPGGAFVPNGGK